MLTWGCVFACCPLLQAVGSTSQESAKALQQKLAAGVQVASSGVADSISRVQQVAAEHSTHSSSMAGKLEAQTKVRGCCFCTAHKKQCQTSRAPHVKLCCKGGITLADVLLFSAYSAPLHSILRMCEIHGQCTPASAK
jgi:hypothetical protein